LIETLIKEARSSQYTITYMASFNIDSTLI